jgi:hypothetical protein
LVVQAYCAAAGDAADKVRTASAKKYRTIFMEAFPTTVFVRVVLSACRQVFADSAC